MRSSSRSVSATRSKPGADLRAAKAQQPKADAAGRARAGRVAEIAAEIAGDDIGEIAQPVLERDDVRGVRAFLRAENARRAARAEQRILHVAGGDDLRQFDARLRAGCG